MSTTNALPLVLVPGLMCTGDLFRDQVSELSRTGDVFIADHTQQSTMAGIAQHILQRAPARFALAGLSMGGYIAFELLRQAPCRIDRLALLNSNARGDRPEQIAFRHLGIAMAQAIGARAAQAYMMKQLIHRDRLSETDLVNRIMSMADGTGAAAFERQQLAIIGRPDNRAFLSSIHCPALIIVGAEDRLTPVKVAEEMAAGIPGSQLEVIEHCGHLSTMERPQQVTALLQTWLQKRGQP